MIRAFVGISVPPETEAMLSAAQAGLTVGHRVPAENFHITLGFFDDCDRHVAADIDAGLSAIRGGRMELWFDGLGMFGDPRPRVLYASLKQDPELTRLREKVLTAARGAA